MKLKKSQIKVNPKKAEELLRFNTYAGQRNLGRNHVEELAKKMADGRFHNGNIALIHNGSTLLADGQHQLTACIASGKQFDATLLEFECEKDDTKEDIAEVFAQFNVDRSRSRGDIAWIYGCQIGMAEWPRKCVTLCNTALGWIASGCQEANVSRLSKDESARLLSAHKVACRFIYEIAFTGNPKESRHLQRSPVVAAMMTTFRREKGDADLFWQAVRDGDMLKRTDPTFKLREFLLRSACALGAGARSDKVSASPREMYAKCIHAWNAYRAKTTTDLKYYPNSALPAAK